MPHSKIVNDLRLIQNRLESIFKAIKIPYTQKIEEIKPLSEQLILTKKDELLHLLDEIIKTFQDLIKIEYINKTQ